MGKRSDFPRRAMDDYETPAEAVTPLLPHLGSVLRFAEPCAGKGKLIGHLERAGLICVYAAELRTGINPPRSRIEEGVDVLAVGGPIYRAAKADTIISNPPWTREILHPLIWHLCGILPTWLLFDADWCHTKQSGALIRHCQTVVSVGRVKWMPDSDSVGKDNAAWHLFDRRHVAGPQFVGRIPNDNARLVA